MRIFRSMALVMLLAATGWGQEMVDSPQYLSWAKHKPGTKVAHQVVTNMGAMNVTQDMVHTLRELTDDKAVIDITVVTNAGGMKQEQKQSRDIARKVKKGFELQSPDAKGTFKETGSEKVQVLDKSYDCKVYEFASEAQGMKVTGKLWGTADVPGYTVKVTTQVDQPATATSTMTVTSIETK